MNEKRIEQLEWENEKLLNRDLNSSNLIFSKMIAIKKDIGPIAKGQNNKMQNYKYRGIDDIYNSIHEVMAKHGVFSIPKVLKTNREERQSKQGGILIWTHLKIKYTFYAEDGSNVEAIITGEAMDSGDKSNNKALSAAEKYCLIQTFKIPTNEIKDSEASSPEVSKPNLPLAQKPKNPMTISPDQVKRLYTIASVNKIPNMKIKEEVLKPFNYGSATEIRIEDYDEIVKKIESL